MVNIDISKLSYDRSLAQFVIAVMGGGLIAGILICDPAVRAAISPGGNTGIVIAVAYLLGAGFLSYVVGICIYAAIVLACIPFGPLSKKLADRQDSKQQKVTPAFPITKPWKTMAVAFLVSLGIEAKPAQESEWREWFDVLHHTFPSNELINQKMSQLMIAMGGILCYLDLHYEPLEFHKVLVFGLIVLVGGFSLFVRRTRFVFEAQHSLELQERGMLQHLAAQRGKAHEKSAKAASG